ncbi:ABC transporter permease [Gryllotalpicola sp.]|uniref:ABC transporter permease n=1 Tax=Gryllotalpicola sp. TaxID=1932787 RepID=UPI002620B4CD|nr:ABC transporter permease [Gryllotalpicola sp.]
MTAVPAKPRGTWLAKVPVLRELRQSVGVQRFMLLVGVIITLVYILVALLAPVIAPYRFNQLQDASGTFPGSAAPSATHLWGTTIAGYDVLSRTLYASQTALMAIVAAVIISLIIGVLLGLFSGYFGGPLDRILVVVCDAIYAFPSLLLAIVISIMLSRGQSSLWSGIMAAALSISVVYVPQYFRVVRSEVVRIKAEAYVESAKVIGAGNGRVLFVHVLRNSVRTLPLIITLNAVDAFETLAGLGFLGLGIEPSSAAEWGYDLQKAVSDVTAGIWWTALFPGLAIVLLALGISLLGEGLNDLADPRLRRRSAEANEAALELEA